MKLRYALATSIALLLVTLEVKSSSPIYTDPSTGFTLHLGNEYLKKQDLEKARQYYDAAIAQEPTSWGPYINRAIVFVRQKKWNLALQDLNTVIRLKPGHLVAALMRCGVNESLGNYGRALDEYDRLIKITSSELPLTCAWALNGRAWIRATCSDPSFRNGDQAVADARRACHAMSWRDVYCIDTLAAAYAETGDFTSAIRFEEQAISGVAQDALVRSIKDRQQRGNETARIVAGLRRHLAAYERHQPWRSNRD